MANATPRIPAKTSPWQRGLGHLEHGVAAMALQPGAGLYQPFAEAGERPALDLDGLASVRRKFARLQASA